jgi:GGDEF domain-containing protein
MHLNGDHLLVAVAEAIRIRLDRDEFAGRYGVDEFVIVFQVEQCEQAFLLMEHICKERS